MSSMSLVFNTEKDTFFSTVPSLNLMMGNNKFYSDSTCLLQPITAENCQSSSVQVYSEHFGKHQQYSRDIILGINDGLVSTVLLVTGVSGGGLSSKQILLTAMSGGLAGAVSMFAGEYIATRSQDQVLEGEIKLETDHIKNYHTGEINELPKLFEKKGMKKIKGL